MSRTAPFAFYFLLISGFALVGLAPLAQAASKPWDTTPWDTIELSVARLNAAAFFAVKSTASNTSTIILTTNEQVTSAYHGTKSVNPKSAPFEITYTYHGKDITSDLRDGGINAFFYAFGESKIIVRVRPKRDRTLHYKRVVRVTINATSGIGPGNIFSSTAKFVLRPR